VIQSSPDLVNWLPLQTNLVTGLEHRISVPVTPAAEKSFFRALAR
jgi:hypothetical protein